MYSGKEREGEREREVHNDMLMSNGEYMHSKENHSSHRCISERRIILRMCISVAS